MLDTDIMTSHNQASKRQRQKDCREPWLKGGLYEAGIKNGRNKYMNSTTWMSHNTGCF